MFAVPLFTAKVEEIGSGPVHSLGPNFGSKQVHPFDSTTEDTASLRGGMGEGRGIEP